MPNINVPARLEDIDQREERSFNPRVPTAEEMKAGVQDYGACLTDIQQSLKHLGRAIPNGQRAGCITALAVLRNAQINLMQYMESQLPGTEEQVEAALHQVERNRFPGKSS